MEQLRGTPEQIRTKLQAEIARLEARRVAMEERRSTAKGIDEKRKYRKRIREYNDRISTIANYSNSLSREELTKTSSRARVYMAIKGTDDYDKAKRVAAYSYQERQSRAETRAYQRNPSDVTTTTNSVMITTEAGKQYRVDADNPDAVRWAEERFGVAITPENQAAADVEAKNRMKISGMLRQQDELKEQAYSLASSAVFASEKTAKTPTFSTYSEYKGISPSSVIGRTKSFFSDVKAGARQILLGSSSTDQYIAMDSGARPLGYQLGQAGGFIGSVAVGTGAAKVTSSALVSAKTWTPVARVLSTRAGGMVATVATTVGTMKAGKAFSDFRTGSTFTLQQRELIRDFGAGAIQAGLEGKRTSYYGVLQDVPVVSAFTKGRKGGSVGQKLLGTGMRVRDTVGGYAFSSSPLDRQSVETFAKKQGLNSGEAATLFEAASARARGRGFAEMGAYTVGSTVTELSGFFQASKTFYTSPSVFTSKAKAASFVGKRVGVNSAFLGAAEGGSFVYAYQSARDIPLSSGYKVGGVTIPSVAVGAVAGAASAGTLGYYIAKWGVSRPKLSRFTLGAAYLGDPFESVGDVSAKALTSGAVRRGVVRTPAVLPKGKTFTVSAFSATKTPSTTPTTDESFSLPSSKRRWRLPSFTPSSFTPTPVAIPTAFATPSPSTTTTRTPTSTPAPAPVPVPSFTPSTTPTVTPSTTPATTPSTTPTTTTTPSTTPTLTPSLIPTFTPTPQVPFIIPPKLPRSTIAFPKFGFKRNKRQPKRYTPSFYAVGLGIKGGKPSRKALKTGLSLRPIIEAFNGQRRTKRRSY